MNNEGCNNFRLREIVSEDSRCFKITRITSKPNEDCEAQSATCAVKKALKIAASSPHTIGQRIINTLFCNECGECMNIYLRELRSQEDKGKRWYE